MSKSEDEKTKRPVGRPRMGAQPKRQVPIRVSADVAEYICTHDNRSAFVEALVKRTKGFKDWKAAR